MTKLPPLQGVIFDMDGVLVDSEPFITEAAMGMFAEMGHTVQHGDFLPFTGTGENRFIGGVAEKYGIPLEIENAKKRTYAIYLELIKGRLEPLPGVFDFLAECEKRKMKLAVASSADAIKVEANLREIGLSTNRFDAVLNGNMVEHKKPAPDIFLLTAKRIGLSPSVCMVVEDAVAGVAAAKAAGSRCLALTTSYPAERLSDANWIVPNLAHVPSAIWQ